MPTKEIQVTVENQILKLSNLDKVLFPYSGIIKAELIQYYQQIAPILLPHIQNRPLTLIRYPDGIDKVKFYSKNKADWTPSWIASTKMPEPLAERSRSLPPFDPAQEPPSDSARATKPESEEIEYVMANNTATLVWLANLAAIELHSMTILATNFLPDVFIFDLDPPEGIDFEEIKKIAWELKLFLEVKGHHPFLKTSGSKGLHIYVPIFPEYATDQVVEYAKSLSREFITTHPNTTLLVSKERRTNKILIDIYRNHRSQTCAAAYSVRGKEGAPVSCPIFWDELENLKSSQQYTIRNIFEYLDKKGDPWAKIRDFLTPLNPNLEPDKNQEKTVENSDSKSVTAELNRYSEKRNFEKTNEPIPEIINNTSGKLRYVIQKHDATNLHYDLRLESDGMLLSWAIPKALPIIPSEKRMAIQTEPHPMKYIDFEGIIPKEEYGGGEMWVFDTGELTYIKKEENKIRFILSKGKIVGEFYIYNTDGNKWLVERQENGLLVNTISVKPMLADLALKIPKNIENKTGILQDKTLTKFSNLNQYSFEIKWDGIRVLVRKTADKVEIISRNGNDLTDKFPEIVKSILEMDIQTGLMDGEIVCLDAKGIPDFAKVISRMHLTGKEAIEKASIFNKATCYLFDLLYLDGLDTRNLPLEKRRKWLQISFNDTLHLRFSQSFEDGEALFTAIKAQGMEGIICKRKVSKYQNNVRCSDWLKVKVRNTEDAIIIGYTRGKGDRALLFGSLILAQFENEKLIYKGKVGTGFDEQKLKEILAILSKIPKCKKLISENFDEESTAIWIEPKLCCEVQIASLTTNNTFREPVFVKMKEIDEL